MVIPAVLSNISIVIVEDHAAFLSMLGRFLMLEGACVVAASDVFDGIRAVKEHHPAPDQLLEQLGQLLGGQLPERIGHGRRRVPHSSCNQLRMNGAIPDWNCEADLFF